MNPTGIYPWSNNGRALISNQIQKTENGKTMIASIVQKTLVWVLAVFLCNMFAACNPVKKSTTESGKPNIIFFIADDMRPEYFNFQVIILIRK